jgi:L-aspartate oxidase
MEFMQFHPTCLYHPQARNFLISEALRGEGGELVDFRGRAFMSEYHKLGSLAPRDIVARSIDAELKKTGAESVFLDITSKPREYLEKRFPHIYKQCLKLGIDMAVQPIPVVPAAHYLCGGILTNDCGVTDVEGLYALGETACSGLHGANRLASNSLLECLALSDGAAKHVIARGKVLLPSAAQVPEWPQSHLENPDELIVIHHMWDEIRRLMWNYVGIVRTDRRLERASHRLQTIQSEVLEYYSSFKTHADIEELRNLALVASLTVRCALSRKESRGIHYNLDYPDLLPVAKDSIA